MEALSVDQGVFSDSDGSVFSDDEIWVPEAISTIREDNLRRTLKLGPETPRLLKDDRKGDPPMVAYANYMNEMMDRAPEEVWVADAKEILATEYEPDKEKKEEMIKVQKKLKKRHDKAKADKKKAMDAALKPRPPMMPKPSFQERKAELLRKADVKKRRMEKLAEEQRLEAEEKERAKQYYHERTKGTILRLVCVRRFVDNLHHLRAQIRFASLEKAKKKEAAGAVITKFSRRKSQQWRSQKTYSLAVRSFHVTMNFIICLRIARKNYNVRLLKQFLTDCAELNKYKIIMGMYVRRVKVVQRFVRRCLLVIRARAKFMYAYWQVYERIFKKRLALKEMQDIKEQKSKNLQKLQQKGATDPNISVTSRSSTILSRGSTRDSTRASIASARKLSVKFDSMHDKVHSLELDADMVHAKHSAMNADSFEFRSAKTEVRGNSGRGILFHDSHCDGDSDLSSDDPFSSDESDGENDDQFGDSVLENSQMDELRRPEEASGVSNASYSKVEEQGSMASESSWAGTRSRAMSSVTEGGSPNSKLKRSKTHRKSTVEHEKKKKKNKKNKKNKGIGMSDPLYAKVHGILHEKRKIHMVHVRDGLSYMADYLAPCTEEDALTLMRNPYNEVKDELARTQLYSLKDDAEKKMDKLRVQYFRPITDTTLGPSWLSLIENSVVNERKK